MANGESLTIANALLKNVYSEGVNDQINSETIALNGIQASASSISTVGGAGVVFSVHFGRNHGIGARNELELIPAAGQQQYARGTTGLKNLYGTIQVTGQVMNQAAQDYQSFVNVVNDEVARLKTDLAVDQNRQVYGNATGTLATTTATTSGFTLTFDEVKYVQVGARVDLLQFSTIANPTPTPRNPSAGVFLTVTAVTPTAGISGPGTITFDQTMPTITAGDVLVRSGGTVNSWKKELNGFGNIISNTGVLHGIDPATYPQWVSTVSTGAGTLTELKLNAVVQAIRGNGAKPSRILTTPGVYNAYWSALQSLRQYVNKTDLFGGVGGLAFSTAYGDIPLVTDFACPSGVAWFPSDDQLQINTNVGWEWIDEQGTMWQKLVQQDGFVAEMRNYSEITTRRRNAHGKLSGITEV